MICYPSPLNAKLLALMALIAAIELRSIQGTYTKPKIGSQVKPRLCSNPIFAEFEI
jgi:hypothetical protein